MCIILPKNKLQTNEVNMIVIKTRVTITISPVQLILSRLDPEQGQYIPSIYIITIDHNLVEILNGNTL